ncbi:hypothetical protein A6R68_01814, partial [Neotoma lepida]
LGPLVVEGESVLGVCHIFESFNDSFIYGSDVYGEDNICHVTNVAHRFKEMSVPALHLILWASVGNWAKIPGLGVHSVLRALAC